MLRRSIRASSWRRCSRRRGGWSVVVFGMERSDYERVLGVARRLASTDDLDEVLGEIIDAMRDVLCAERASVFTWEPGVGGAGGSFVAAAAHGLGRSFRVSGDRGVIAEARRSGRVVNVGDVSREVSFNPAVDEATGFRTRCVLAAPMLDSAGELVGVVQVLNKVGVGGGGGVFTAEDEAVALHLAAQAGVALRRAVLMAAARRRDVLEAEIGAAREVQRAAMPRALPDVSGWLLSAAWEPAVDGGGAAGDVYDAVLRRDGGSVCVLLADASGHGVGPAVSVSRAQAMFRFGVRAGFGLDAVASRMNECLCEDLPTGHFVTAFVGEFAAGGDVVRYVSAGQSPVVVFGGGGHESRDALLPPLGVGGFGGGVEVLEVGVDVGGGVAVVSDGLMEGAGALDDEAVAVIARGSADAGRALIEGAGGAGEDDRTALVVRRCGRARG